MKLYLVPERSPAEKDRNRETLTLAGTIQAQRIIELREAAHGGLSNTGTRKQKMLLCDFVKHIADKKKEQGGNNPTSTYLHYRTLYSHLLNYAPKATIKEASSKEFCAGFIDYLQTAKGRFTGREISGNTRFIYVRVLGAVFSQAIKAGIIKENPLNLFGRRELPMYVKPEIDFLTLDEVKRLHNTPCAFPEIKAAYLFSCFTGLRFSDVKALTWGQLRQDNIMKQRFFTGKRRRRNRNIYHSPRPRSIFSIPESAQPIPSMFLRCRTIRKSISN